MASRSRSEATFRHGNRHDQRCPPSLIEPHELIAENDVKFVRAGFPGRQNDEIAGVTLLVVISVAGSNDVLASNLETSLQTVTWILRISTFVLPVLFGWLAWRWARMLQDRESPAASDEAPENQHA